MKNIKKTLVKLTVLGIVTTSMLTIAPISAYAQFRNDSVGWWYIQPNGEYATGWVQDKGNWYYLETNGYMKTGWQQDNNKWYYLNSDGSMAHDTTINGYKVGSDGAWIKNNTTNVNSNNVTNTSTTNNANSNNTTSTNNIINNINYGTIVNGNVNIGNTNKQTNTISSDQQDSALKTNAYNGTDGFIKKDDNKYVYYENGQILKNTWKKFDNGYRHFDEKGYLSLRSADGLEITENGLVPLTNEYPYTIKQMFRDLKPYNCNGTIFISGNLDYIKQTYDIFGVKYRIEYQDVYDKDLNGEIMSIGDHFINHADTNDNKFQAEKVIEIGKYKDRLGID